eukprot:TRINITY_DN46008_c0_g2_i1.p1 TRINITY_DN46008_c0_g2~~TRINITY_DN46008_c0_g2_i1.p1  ORF type:complete len:158 (-),score=10.44 TRINITY_DN46008_c0_g2_i1:341-814(-)
MPEQHQQQRKKKKQTRDFFQSWSLWITFTFFVVALLLFLAAFVQLLLADNVRSKKMGSLTLKFGVNADEVLIHDIQAVWFTTGEALIGIVGLAGLVSTMVAVCQWGMGREKVPNWCMGVGFLFACVGFRFLAFGLYWWHEYNCWEYYVKHDFSVVRG